MAEYSIYNDITNRTGGDVYIGVVGPVRTGKSTFIKKFMDTLVIPNIEDEYLMEQALDELPVSQISLNLPSWICALKDEHPLKRSVYDAILKSFDGIGCIRDVKNAADSMCEYDFVEKTDIESMDLSKGAAQINISAPEEMFYNILSEMTGLYVENEDSLISIMCDLADTKKQYDKFAYALHEVEQTGYGIVSPGIDDLELAEPEIVRQGARFGVRLKAAAPSIHMIRNKPKSLEAA